MRILALTKYGADAASTRQRFVQYRRALAEAGFDLEISPLFDDRHVRRLAAGKRAHLAGVLGAYARRVASLLRSRSADLLWVHCEMFPYWPGTLERAAFLSRKPVVYDFDDAIFHMYDAAQSRLVRRLLGTKLRPLIARATEIIAGNSYLAAYAGRWNDRVTTVPTVVDTDVYVPAEARPDRPVTIGWIGSPSTWKVYVRPHLGLIRQVCEETGARFLAVGTAEDGSAGGFPGLELRPWAEEREVPDIHDMDLGIMPLPDDHWARGKCGYKLIQYMACGLPTIASPVGVNGEITVEGETGLLADTPEEWRAALTALIADADRRRRMGEKGRERVVRSYSLQSQAPRLVEVMRRAAAAR